MNLLMLLEMAAEAAGDRVALGPRDGGTTYRQLLDAARSVAADLGQRGIEVAAMLDETSAALPVWLFGAAAAGRAFAPLNYRLSDPQLHAALAELAPAACLIGPEQAARAPDTPDVEFVARNDVLQQLGNPPTNGPASSAPVDVDEAVLLFTSGTTGAPKVVVLRHEHLVAYVLSTVEFLSAGADEAILVSVPPYHIAGVSTILTSVYAGRRMVQLPTFTPEGWVDLVRDEQVTQAMVVPTMLARILDVLEDRGEGLPALRHLAYGGGRMPRPVVERALRLLPDVDFVNAYGLTETASTITVLGPDDHRAAIASDDPRVRQRLASVGRPVPSVDVEVRSPTGQPVGPGEVGEVHVRGPQVSGEYRSHRAVDDDGWFPTRDAGWVDDEGYLYLEGRADDVIVRGAENLSPGEIEDVLLAHSAVVDAAVVGVPDVEWGERVEAAVVLVPGSNPSEDELRQWVRDRLRSSKTPDRIHLRPDLPRTDLGKLQRVLVRQDLAAVQPTPR